MGARVGAEVPVMRRAAILSTGDELTSGRTVDTNAAFLAERLVAAGFEVVGILVVGDDSERLQWAWRTALGRAEVVLGTGGLGPTADDLMTETVAAVSGRPLFEDEEVVDRIRGLFVAMGREMPENNRRQARFPEGAVVIPNPFGTAPGYRLALDQAGALRHLIVMPGVPREMRAMFENEVLPWLRSQRGGTEVFRSRTLQTFGLSESALDEQVAGVVAPEEGKVSFRAAFPRIAVRVTVWAEPKVAEARLEDVAARLRERLGPYCYAQGDVSMEEVVGRLLVDRGWTLGVAESCTGGLVGHRLTDVAGSSRYFKGAVVAYDNSVKESVLGVDKAALAAHGAVSVEVAARMAAGARRVLGSDLGLATTGIAGPGGGTAAKPVGTFCVGLANAERTVTKSYQLWGPRTWFKLLASQIALDWVRRLALGLEPSESAPRRR